MKVPVQMLAAIAFLLAPSAVQAQNRYVEPPPVLVSPDLSAPWIQQLRQNQERRKAARARHDRQARPPAVRRQAEQRHVRELRSRQRQARQAPREERRSAALRRAPRATPAPARTPRPRPFYAGQLDPRFLPQTVPYDGPHGPGTVIVDTNRRFLFLVDEGGTARRYGVGVGKPGFEWSGTHRISRKREWPDWRPPAEMVAREKRKGRVLPTFVKGGPQNPLGARALYLGSTLYRIHGTNAPQTIGKAVSSGCIRMRNEDVIDLFQRVSVGTKVVVL